MEISVDRGRSSLNDDSTGNALDSVVVVVVVDRTLLAIRTRRVCEVAVVPSETIVETWLHHWNHLPLPKPSCKPPTGPGVAVAVEWVVDWHQWRPVFPFDTGRDVPNF